MRKNKRITALVLAVLLAATPSLQASASSTNLEKKQENELSVKDKTEEESGQTFEAESEKSSKEETFTESSEAKTSETDTEEINTEEKQTEITEVETEESQTDAEESKTEETDTQESQTEETDIEESQTEETDTEESQTEETDIQETLIENETIGADSDNEEAIPDVEKYLNYMDVDVDSEIPNKRGFGAEDLCYTFEELPSYYNGYEEGRVSEVKDQNPFGSCWSFSAVAIAESAYMKLYDKAADEVNLSESHLIEFFYNNDDDPLYTETSDIADDIVTPIGDTQEERGGNSVYTLPVLASWKGIADESLDESLKYETAVENNEADIDSKYAFEDIVHLENAYYIPIADKEGIKSAIMEFGGVASAYYYSSTYDSNYYNGEAYYCPVNKGGTNHAITIVGWDDNYSIDNFKETTYYKNGNKILPGNNGAWLIKNSWGSEYHNTGFFWISYEDATIYETAYAFDFGRSDNYDYNYQYDGGVNSAWISFATEAAAIYKAVGNQELKAVGVSLRREDENFKVEIYTNLTDMANPESGELVHSQQCLSSYQGFYTVKLDESIKLNKDESFSVVIKSLNDKECENGKQVYFACDTELTKSDWISSTASFKEGQTFYKSGSTWTDAKKLSVTIRIKAYTDISAELVTDMIEDVEDQIYTGEEITPEIIVTAANGKALVKDKDYTLSYADNISIGTASVVVTGKGKYYGSVEVTFNIIPIPVTENMIQASDKIYDGQIYNEFEVIYNEQILDETNYDVEYEKVTVNEVTNEDTDEILEEAPIDAGKYNIIIKGKGIFSGEAKAQFLINPLVITPEMVSAENAFYNGRPYDKVLVNNNGNTLTENTDYTISYYLNETSFENLLDSAPVQAGSYVAVIEGKINYSGKVEIAFTIEDRPLEGVNVETEIEDQIYSGKEIIPDIVLTSEDGTVLVENQDYTLAYYDNINVGMASIVIAGEGIYAGTIVINFNIIPKPVTSDMINASNKIYDGQSYNSFEVHHDELVLDQTDYDVSYEKVIINSDTNETTTEALDEVPIDTGKYNIVITGKGNFTGEAKSQFLITPILFTDEMLTASDIIYNGNEYSEVQINVPGLDSSKYEYSMEYYENKIPRGEALSSAPASAGKYIAMVELRGNCAGTVEKEFIISPLVITEEMVSAEDIVFNAQSYEAFDVYFNEELLGESDYTVSYEKVILQEDTGEYTIVELTQAPIDAGSYNIVITGNGNFDGEVKVQFNIIPVELTSEILTVSDMVYNGNEYDQANLEIPDFDTSEYQYTIKYYKNETPRGDQLISVPVDAGEYVIQAVITGNCAGVVEKEFIIQPCTITEENISANNMSYNGLPYDKLKLIVGGNELSLENCVLSFYRNEQPLGQALESVPADAGNYCVVIEGVGNYTGTVQKTFTIERVRIEVAASNVNYNNKAYDGIVVTADGKKIESSNYTITYYKDETPRENALEAAPSEAGRYVAIVEGIGNYEGTVEAVFEIGAISISDADVQTIFDEENNFEGVSVFVGEYELKENTDCEIKYYDFINNITMTEKPQYPGDYQIKVTGKGNYKDEVSKIFTIPYNSFSANMFEVNDSVYNGTVYNAVKAKGIRSENYEVTYNKTPVNAGSYIAKIDGRNKFEGQIIYNFKIEKLTLSEEMIADIQDYEYTGKLIKPNIVITSDGNEIPKSNYTVKYSNNKNSGTATVTVVGKANCQGTIKKTFNILPKNVKELTITVPKAVYTGNLVMPKPVVKDGNKTLKSGKDYTISYSENIVQANKNNPKITITGCGNYAGSKTVSFVIEPMQINANMLKAQLYSSSDKEVYLDVYLNNKLLTNGNDYSFKLVNQSTQKQVTNLKNIELGEKYTIVFSFKGNYTSKEPVTVKNVVCNISIDDFDIKFIENGEYVSQLSSLIYNKKAQKPKVVLVSGDEVLKASNYSVSYKNNINAGTATVTVTGKGQYSGSKSIDFKILPKDLGSDIKITGLDDKIYTGKEIKPVISIKGLKCGINNDFWITEYKNNLNANSSVTNASQVTIQLSDNYCINGKNTILKTFNIKPAKVTTVKVEKAYYQNGNAVKPKLTVMAGKLILNEADYKVKWSNNTNIGNASVEISLKTSKGNFYMEKPIKIDFIIAKESLNKVKAVQIKKPAYKGKIVDFSNCFVLYDYMGNVIDKNEYDIIPNNRTFAGKVSVTFKAKADSKFAGKKTVKCTVEPAYIGDYLELTETGLPEKYYNNGKQIKFTKNELKAAFRDKVTGEAILPNSFTVKYENNREKGEAKLYITGKKNYSGTMVIKFKIN